MVLWTSIQKNALGKYKSKQEVPINERKYKCTACKKIINSQDLIDGNCPICGNKPDQMCPVDTIGCNHIVSGLEYCPICGELMCPECGSHDVEVTSRVTGYNSLTSNWNEGKKQELKDRHRVSI